MQEKTFPPKDFSGRLELALLRAGMTKARLAEALGVPASTVSRWKGIHFPSPVLMASVAKTLAVRREWLVVGLDPMAADCPDSDSAPPLSPHSPPAQLLISAQDELLSMENIALLGGLNARMLLDKMFDKAKADLSYYQRNARAINLLVDYLKTNPEP